MFFLIKIAKREITYLQDDVASGASWRAGLPRGCDVALRPRGRAMGGPREAQKTHRARTSGRRPCVFTRPRGCPCGAPRGTVGGRHMEGPLDSGP